METAVVFAISSVSSHERGKDELSKGIKLAAEHTQQP